MARFQEIFLGQWKKFWHLIEQTGKGKGSTEYRVRGTELKKR
jgi:hypothetical protein